MRSATPNGKPCDCYERISIHALHVERDLICNLSEFFNESKELRNCEIWPKMPEKPIKNTVFLDFSTQFTPQKVHGRGVFKGLI